ncbi:uncharacterized protein VTP21DRAFT_8344 [Calcarisporiella thermophila]|uniref:uncharacterized protein n=1 Tax=Calcarisporiella thermophila TaxID=911321 RepID=UPI003742E0E7
MSPTQHPSDPSSSDPSTSAKSTGSIGGRSVRRGKLSVQIPVSNTIPQPNSADSASIHSPAGSKSRWQRGSTAMRVIRDLVNWPVPASLRSARTPRSPFTFGNGMLFDWWRWKHRLWRLRPFRLAFFLFMTWCVVLTSTHFARWLLGTSDSEASEKRFDLKRTYDPDEPFSVISQFSNSYLFSKLFSNELPTTLEHIDPYYLRAESIPVQDDVSIVTVLDERGVDTLRQLAERWNGPISATLAITTATDPLPDSTQDALRRFRDLHQQNPTVRRNVDLHLVLDPPVVKYVQPRRNMHRNLARLFARTDHVAFLGPDSWPVTDLYKTLQQEPYRKLLREGHALVLPTFAYLANTTAREVPASKGAVLRMVAEGQLVLYDQHWKLGFGPTRYDKWIGAERPYPVVDYELHYSPSVVMAKQILPWCSERFSDNLASCYYGLYLSGAEFYVLPEDFLVYVPTAEPEPAGRESLFEKLFGQRLYLKYQQEQCLYHAGKLISLGLWNTHWSTHCKRQCSNVLRTWGRGLL